MTDLPRLLTPQDAAAQMGLPEAALTQALAAGAVDRIVIAGRIYLTVDAVLSWLSVCTVKATSSCPSPPAAAAPPPPAPASSGSNAAGNGSSAGRRPDAEQRSARQAMEIMLSLQAPPSLKRSTRKPAPSKKPRPAPPPDPRQAELFPAAVPKN